VRAHRAAAGTVDRARLTSTGAAEYVHRSRSF
jgi:hypothetical protein